MGKAGAVTDEGRAWSDWRLVSGVPPLTAATLAEILDGGQAFRWYRVEADTWIGAWSAHVVRLRLTQNGDVEWSAPAPLAERTGPALQRYLGSGTDFLRHTDDLPWRSDAHLATTIEAFRGLRILHQPFGETLLGFLCSATKQIVQIKQMVGLLAERHGRPLQRNIDELCQAVPAAPRSLFHQLPTWTELSRVPESELRQCQLGFRARYIAETAEFLAGHPGWLEETEAAPYATAKERLCELPGVGEKVADCVLLFGAGRLEAFPVDVWILKTMATRYGLHGWKPTQLTQFGRAHFGPLAGFAQQFLFAWERRIAPKTRGEK